MRSRRVTRAGHAAHCHRPRPERADQGGQVRAVARAGGAEGDRCPAVAQLGDEGRRAGDAAGAAGSFRCGQIRVGRRGRGGLSQHRSSFGLRGQPHGAAAVRDLPHAAQAGPDRAANALAMMA